MRALCLGGQVDFGVDCIFFPSFGGPFLLGMFF